MRLNQEQINLLLSGLTSLEGALNSLSQPLPPTIVELRKLLRSELTALDSLQGRQGMTTKEVATILNTCPRNVAYLARKGKINLLVRGERGRGKTALFDNASIAAFIAESDRSP